MVTAWAGEYGLALGQEVCAAKSNEITAIPELLKKIDVRGGIVTIDAMGTQKAIAEAVVRGKADYVLALKRNHETLHREVVDYIDEQLEGELEEAQELTTTERGHGREDERTYLQLPVPKGLPGRKEWKGLKSVGVVTSRRVKDGAESIEIRYYLSSLAVDVGPVRPGGARPLVGGECVSLEPRRHLPRGRLPRPRAGAGLEHHLAVPIHPLRPQATSRPTPKPDHETTRLRMVRQVLDRHGFWGRGRSVSAEGGGDQQVLQPVVVVAMPVEPLGGASPALVLSRRRRVPGGEVPQQRPGPAVEPAGGPRAVQVLAVVEVAVHPAHQPVEHVARPVAAGVAVRDRPRGRASAQVQDLLQDDPAEMLLRPAPQRPQPLPEAPPVGGVVRLPDPPRDLGELVLQVLAPLPDLEPGVQEALEDDDALEQAPSRPPWSPSSRRC